MSTMTMQAVTPWAMTHEEDRRFRWILLQTLTVSLVIGVITRYIHLPQPEADIDQQLPLRRVKLLVEQSLPAPLPAPSSSPTAPVAPAEIKPQPETQLQSLPEPQPEPESQTAAKQTRPAPALTPRQKAASSGVLAMADALRELQASKPRTGTTPTRQSATGEAYRGSSQPSILTENVTRGSGGVEGGVTHQAVLGTADLPEREASQGGKGLARSEKNRTQTAQASPGNVRSQEQIQEQLDHNKGAMYTLYNRELRKNASLQGKLVISITIAPAGHVTRCVILSSELDSTSLEQQLVALISRMDFGNKPAAGVVTTRIPIEFFPR